MIPNIQNDIADLSSDDKEDKKVLAIETIYMNCESSPHKIFQEMAHVLSLDDKAKLEGTFIDAGCASYSYKVFVDKYPEIGVFAKLSFYSSKKWDNSSQHDFERAENEWNAIKSFSSVKPDCVPSLLGSWDLEKGGQRMKLFVASWSNNEEHFSNQFIDGSVDPRIAPKLADTLAGFHNVKDFNSGFKDTAKPCTKHLIENVTKAIQKACNEKVPQNRTETYCVFMGEKIVTKIIDAHIADFHKGDCFIHNDLHTFNILVENKPSFENFESFGANGSMLLCNWEMASVGSIGKDIGFTFAFPISCMVAHALNGHLDANESIEKFISSFWEHYSSKMKEAGLNPEQLASIYRSSIGWCGWFMISTLYFCNSFSDSFPVESEKSKLRLKDALGVMGLKFMRLSYDTGYSKSIGSEAFLQTTFKSLWQDEVMRAYSYSGFVAGTSKKLPRTLSLLRSSSRQLGDSFRSTRQFSDSRV